MTSSHPTSIPSVLELSSPSLCSVKYRQIKFNHLVSGPMGTMSASGTKYQTICVFTNVGMVMDCRTALQGVHSADCFHVDQRWLIESNFDVSRNKSITLTIKFQVRFVKKTMWRAMIEKMTKAETQKWFDEYVQMIQKSIKKECVDGSQLSTCNNIENGGNSSAEIKSESASSLHEVRSKTKAVIIFIFLVFFFSAFSVTVILWIALPGLVKEELKFSLGGILEVRSQVEGLERMVISLQQQLYDECQIYEQFFSKY